MIAAQPLARIEHQLAVLLERYSATALRLSMGLVFLVFGVLKFLPGVSPAEGLAVVNLLAFETQLPSADGRTYPAAPNLTAFSGQQPALPSDDCLVVVNTLNTHPVLGAVALLNCHRIVFPLVFGVADATDDWSVCDWCDQCHRKGGLTLWSDFAGGAGGAV